MCKHAFIPVIVFDYCNGMNGIAWRIADEGIVEKCSPTARFSQITDTYKYKIKVECVEGTTVRKPIENSSQNLIPFYPSVPTEFCCSVFNGHRVVRVRHKSVRFNRPSTGGDILRRNLT